MKFFLDPVGPKFRIPDTNLLYIFDSLNPTLNIHIASMNGIIAYIYHHLPLKSTLHVGKYTIPTDAMGMKSRRRPVPSFPPIPSKPSQGTLRIVQHSWGSVSFQLRSRAAGFPPEIHQNVFHTTGIGICWCFFFVWVPVHQASEGLFRTFERSHIYFTLDLVAKVLPVLFLIRNSAIFLAILTWMGWSLVHPSKSECNQQQLDHQNTKSYMLLKENLELQATIFKLMFGETTICCVKTWYFQRIKNIKKWLFRVPRTCSTFGWL